MKYESYLSEIDRNAEEICSVSDAIWSYAETAFDEYDSMRTLTAALERHGFTVERGIAGMPTAFRATYGSGKPAMGILAEYDALSGLNQEGNATEPRPRPNVPDTGHGCGHNLFAGGSFAAALAVRRYVEETGHGSVTLFGCPAEENGGGKVFLARAGVFNDIDAVVSWHPERMYMVRTRPSLANVSVLYRFTGIAAHAGGSPHRGRSALDAVELMNIGVQFLREHMETTCRIHYAILDSGGEAPNVVQSHAAVRYLIRAETNRAAAELRERVENIARGAALMTDTHYESELVAGDSNLIMIPTLQQTAYEAMQDIPLPTPTEEDIAFGQALQATMTLTDAQKRAPLYPERVLPPAPPVAHGGSTDTSDVSWNCPTVQMHIGTWCEGTPGHSWQAVAQGTSHYAKKAMLYAGKAVASTILRVIESPERLAQVKREHAERTAGGYVCPIPDTLLPEIRPER